MTKVPYIIWKDEYEVDQGELDSQHYRLFEIINKLYEATRSSASNDVLALLHEVREYSQRHFAAEEKLLRQVHYPGLLEQQQAHRGYVSTLATISSEYYDNPSVLSEDLLLFLKNWWLYHIRTKDMEYIPYLKQA